jgi:hypothetical protein
MYRLNTSQQTTEAQNRILSKIWRPRTQVRGNRNWDWADIVAKTEEERYGQATTIDDEMLGSSQQAS